MPQYIYLISAEDTNRYKIGLTNRHPEDRLKEMNSKQSPYRLTLKCFILVPNSKVAEAYFHQRFADYRKHGEWFEFSELIAASVIKEFKDYQPATSYSIASRPAIKKKKAKKRYTRKSSLGTILIVLLVVLAVTQWSRLLQYTTCVQKFNLVFCARNN